MSKLTVEQIMQSIAATVNQEAAAPTTGSTEYNLWLEFINRAQAEWADSNDWEDLRKEYWPAITGSATATVPMPSDFRKLAASPVVYGGDVYGSTYPDIPTETTYGKDSAEKFSTLWGNVSEGYNLIFHPGTLASGASVKIEYFSFPANLSGVTQYSPVQDAQFLVNRAMAYILEARSDPRFQSEEAKARERLVNMVENANLAKYNSFGEKSYIGNPLTKRGFRVGRD